MAIQGEAFAGPVECGRTRPVRVAVTVPVGTARVVTDTVTLTATSRLASGAYAAAQAATVSGYRIYLPLAVRSGG